MALDLTNQEAIKKYTIKDLIADAVERNDLDALKWLQIEANTLKERTKSDGTKYEVKKSIVEIRAEYIKKYLNYKTKGKQSAEAAKARKREKRQQELDALFEKAFEAIGK